MAELKYVSEFSRGFVTVSHFQPIITFTDKARGLILERSPIKGYLGQPPVSPANIILGRK
jgi:hypothetical protein